MVSLNDIAEACSSAIIFLKEPIEAGTKKIVGDAYSALKNLVASKTEDSNDVKEAIKNLENKPESKGRATVFEEELEPFQLSSDIEVERALLHLQTLLEENGAISSVRSVTITQSGKGNKAIVAGRDVINTERFTKKVEFAPDERHITTQQGKTIKELIKKLAEKLANENGKPNFGQAYGRLYSEMDVTTFKEIRREDYEHAVEFLRQQNAMSRSRLRRRNPTAYNNDLFTAIYAKAGSLGWEKPRVYEFAREALVLKRQIKSLKSLGPIQLKRLSQAMDRKIRELKR